MADESDLAEVLHVPAEAPGAASPAPPPAADSLEGTTAVLTGTQTGSHGPPGPAVSDASNPLGAPLAAASQPGAAGAGGGAYTIDVENAPQAIANLYAATDILDEMAMDAFRLAEVRSPGNDVVSQVATGAFRGAAVGPTGLQAALRATAQEFRRQAEKLKADLAAYQQVEEANVVLPAAQPLDFWRKA